MNEIEKLRIYLNKPNATEDDIFDAYYNLDYDDQIKCQTECLGRSLHLVAKDVNTVDECDMYNFFEDMCNMLYVVEEWQDRYTDDEEDDNDTSWHEYGDLYIYATDEEIKAFIADIKKSPFTEDWFGKRYKLQEYN